MERRKFLKASGIGLGSVLVAGYVFDRFGNFGTKENFYLQDNYAPVETLITEDKLEVVGNIPKDLSGLYLRNGPNPMGSINAKKYHWFMGQGMLHGVRIEEGKAIWYRNRLVGSDSYGPNTHVVSHAGKTYAIVEAGGQPVEIDKELNSLAADPFFGTLETGFSAHTKLDSKTGELHAMCYDYASDFENVHHVTVGKDGRVKSTQAIALPSKSMLHECAITENYILVLDLSITFSFYKLGRGYFPFSWNDDHQARIGLLDRSGNSSEVRWFNINPCYFFHTVNAYEDQEGNLIIDAMRYERLFDKDWNGPNTEFSPQLTRWTLDLSSGSANERQLDDKPAELPRMHPELNGQFYQFGYSLGVSNNLEPDFGRIIKYDFVKDRSEFYELGEGKMGAESVFVPSNNNTGEDDGYLLSYVYDRATDKSDLMILNAEDINSGPIAQIKLPQRVPFGFHGNWIPS